MRISRTASIVTMLSVISLFCALAVVGTTYGTDGDIDANVNIAPSLLVTIPTDTVSLNLNPFTSAFGTASLPVTVSTNNPTGFTLNMSASETDLTLVNGSETIPTLADKTGGYSESEFTANRWGYKLSTATNYSPFALSNELLVTDSPSNASTSTVNFASKVDATKPAGTYELEITFTVVANYVPPAVHTIADGGDMQDVSSVAEGGCPSTLPTGQVYQLTDNRGTTPETYNVARLTDGKCWMVENLNLAGGTALSASDTNVDSNYISSFTTSNNLTKTGDTIVLPASSTSGFGTDNYSYVYNSGNKTNCGASGQNTPCYSYYSWDAATLGSGRTISTDNTNAPYSICPKGWRLPTAYTIDATNWQTTSDFYVLAHQYGLDSASDIYEEDSDFYTQAGPGTVPNFLLAGYYFYGSFYNGGSDGFYWSATSGSATNRARNLRFYSSYVHSAYNSFRSNGSSVRCLLAE